MHQKLTSIALTAFVATGMQMHAQSRSTLDALRDHKRVLLVFAGDNDPRVEQQWSNLLGQRNEAAERDVVTAFLTRSRTQVHDGQAPPPVTVLEDEQALRRRFHVAPGEFTVILIGKDGGEKLRSTDPIPWQTLQSTIDAMPMRQSEMRHSR